MLPFNVLNMIHMWLLLMFQANKMPWYQKDTPGNSTHLMLESRSDLFFFSPRLVGVRPWQNKCWCMEAPALSGIMVTHLHTVSKEISAVEIHLQVSSLTCRRKGTWEAVPSEMYRVLKSKPLLSSSLPSAWFVSGSALVFKHAVTIRRPWELRAKNFCDFPPLPRTTLKQPAYKIYLSLIHSLLRNNSTLWNDWCTQPYDCHGVINFSWWKKSAWAQCVWCVFYCNSSSFLPFLG